MNRQDYLRELERELRTSHVRDCDEILEEYNTHFELKLRDGYSEEEIAARLAPPKELAAQFDTEVSGGRKVYKAIVTTGLAFCDLFVGSFFIVLYAWCVVLGSLAVSCAVSGVCLIFRSVYPGFMVPLVSIPSMPGVCALLFGLAMLAAAVLSAIGTDYCARYSTQLLRVYMRWHRAVLGGGTVSISPPMPMYPNIGAKKRRIMRTVVLAALVVFAVCFIAGFVSMIIAARSFEPWHVWNWFV